MRFATVTELAAALRRGEGTAEQLASDTLQALESVGRELNAVASLLPERALAEARRADQRLSHGQAPLLCGIPYGVKDLLAARGGTTTWGAPPFRDQVFNFDATVVAKLMRSSAVLAAKLSLVELASAGGPPRLPGASLHGSGRNPWNRAHYSGGSSSGSAAAVAAGLLPFTLGSETGGSIGLPSAYCGLTGLRPTFGLVSRFGALVVCPSLDRLGPIAHTAQDCGLVLDAIAGVDHRDPFTRAARPQSATSPLEVGQLRIGFAEEDFGGAAEAARAALQSGVDELRQLGCRVEHVLLPSKVPYREALDTVMLAEASATLAPYIESGQFETLVDDRQKDNLRRGLTIPARSYLRARDARTAAKQAFADIFGRIDIVLSFGSPTTAPLLEPRQAPSEPVKQSAPNNLDLRAAANLVGLPGIFFPCGLASNGLPVGLQAVGRPYSEPLLIALVAAYQEHTQHHLRRPPTAHTMLDTSAQPQEVAP